MSGLFPHRVQRALRFFALGFLLFEFFLGFIFLILVPVQSELGETLISPGWAHPFGTDSIGRDLLIRSLQGLSLSGALALCAAFIAGFLGVVWGIWSGWRGGRTDLFFMRILETVEGIPDLLLAVVLTLLIQLLWPSESLGASFFTLALALGLTGWFEIARQARALTLRERQMQYAEAARALGAGHWRILIFHIWPNIQNSIWILILLQIPGFILFEASLSFFGFGLKAPLPSLGQIFLEGWKVLPITSHVVWGPTLLLFVSLLAFRSLLPKVSIR